MLGSVYGYLHLHVMIRNRRKRDFGSESKCLVKSRRHYDITGDPHYIRVVINTSPGRRPFKIPSCPSYPVHVRQWHVRRTPFPATSDNTAMTNYFSCAITSRRGFRIGHNKRAEPT